MDIDPIGRLGGWIGAIVGGGVGVLGGVIGTYFTIKNTRNARERAFAIKASVVCWILVIAFVGAMLWIPTWHKHLLWIPYAILLVLGIRIWNKTQLRIRSEEHGENA